MPIDKSSYPNAIIPDGKALRFIVEVSDGSSTYYFGNFSGKFTEGLIYNRVATFSFAHGVDERDNTTNRASCSLQCDNTPLRQEAEGDYLRVSDLVRNIVGRSAKLYVSNNPDLSAVADYLPVLVGITRSIDGYDRATLRLTLEDRGYLFDTIMLNTKVEDVE